MKTPQQWIDELNIAIQPVGDIGASDIAAIQRDAFEAGRVAGMREALELFTVHSSARYAVARLLEKATDHLGARNRHHPPPTTHE